MGKHVWLRGLGHGLASMGCIVMAALALVVLVPQGQGLAAAGVAGGLGLAWAAAHDATRPR